MSPRPGRAKAPPATVAAVLLFVVLIASILVSPRIPVPDASAQAVEAVDVVAIDHVRSSIDELGLRAADVDELAVTDIVHLNDLGVSVVHLQQQYRGLHVLGGTMHVVVDGAGVVVSSSGGFVPGLAKMDPRVAPTFSDVSAVRAAVKPLGLQPMSSMNRLWRRPGPERISEIEDGGIAFGNITARLVLEPDEGDLRVAWEITVYESDGSDWWQIRIDGVSGRELSRNNLVTHDSYTVYPEPVEAPSFGSRSAVLDPADPVASPFGWHDTDGLPGAESTLTTGNNVDAYADVDGDNVPDVGSRPDGGAGLIFDFPLDFGLPPSASTDAAVTELFYWTNVLHDILYAYGFDEAAGNFQLNNYGNGGFGGDPVRAEVQNNFVNNANFATPVDGFPPRMQIGVWTLGTPDRDGAFDNGVVMHEYAHGVTNRLTGGPNSITCLSNAEQPGEGWSDFFALWVTMQAGDAGTDVRGFGTWSLAEPTTGAGLREHPYSTDMVVNPHTYDDIITATIPHGVGSVFAAMLWDLNWDLTDRYGFDADLINGTGGNNRAMQLVMDALKLQPCSPGFVDARDALLLADTLANAGANQCMIWRAFARRGVGVSAVQGTSASRADGAEAFDVPASCEDLVLTKSAAPTEAVAGEQLRYDLSVANNTASALTGVTIVDPLPAGVTYVAGTVDCGGSFDGSNVSIPVGLLAPFTTVACSFLVDVDPGLGTTMVFVDDLEAGSGGWAVSHGAGTEDWTLSTAFAASPFTSFFASEPAAVTEQSLILSTPVPIGAGSKLRFWHRYDTENTWDGGVVEISTDGVVWTDLGPHVLSNGYVAFLAPGTNPLAGREAFTGDSGGFVETVVDLSSFAGSTARVRFVFGSDDTVSGNGWYVDDVSILDEVWVDNTATATSIEGPSSVFALSTAVAPPPGFLRVTTSPAVPSVIDVDGAFTDAFGLDWVETPPGSYEVCFNDVPGFTTPGCETAMVSTGVTSVVDGTFVQHGIIDIRSSPSLPTTITVDGAVVNDWGALVSAEPGSYQVCFGPVVGHDPPPCETAVVTAGASTIVTGVF
ncbi:MAG: M36 family metallopeptidase, partial [Actinomycetota bacterium]|nr:M36 family metallopeptidase [Actinomycetota bacterium]